MTRARVSVVRKANRSGLKGSISLFLALGLILPALHSPLLAAGKRQVGTSGTQFLKLGVNARAIGMGEAYSAVSTGSDAIYWNPAGLGRVESKSVSLMHAVYLQGIYYDFASYAHRIGSLMVIGAGVQILNARSIDETDEFGANRGTFNPNDLAVSFGFARKFTSFANGTDFMIGVSGKLIRSRIIETARSGAVDLGMVWSPLDQLWVSLGVQNIGPGLKFNNEKSPLPLNVKVGSSYQVYKVLLVSLDVNIPRDNDPNVALGAEYKKTLRRDVWLAGRTGFITRGAVDIGQLSSVSAGVGFGWNSYSVDFAWVPFGRLGSTYRTSLTRDFW